MGFEWRAQRGDDGLFRVVLENERLRLTFLPELGGRLWSLVTLPRDEEMLWHHPTLAPHVVSPGVGYDDAFAGGWDELFPSDRAVAIGGVDYPDHGEWWSQPWAWEVDASAAALRLTLRGRGFATRHDAVRTVTLPIAGPAFTWQTRITNTGESAIPYLWRHHPALPLRPGARLELPAARVEAIAEGDSGLVTAPFTWPRAITADGAPRDLSVLPAADCGEVWMLYATGLPAGYARLTWPGEDGTRHSIGFTFDPAFVTAVTIFATFGGWRDLQAILPEVGVGYPADLRQAVAAGTSGVLGAGETVAYEVRVAVW
ncbi:MAG: DUF5107 domain-containing protein [Thermomicrobiales bacterium]|nr:DUF5107 domain-containing protein [Thermomicrobiales bacterium]